MRTKKKILRRIKTLYCLFFIVVVASVVFSVMGNDFLTGYNDALREIRDESQSDVVREMHSKHIFGLKNMTSKRTHDILIATPGDSSVVVKARVSSFDFVINTTNIDKVYSVSLFVSGLMLILALLAYVAIFVIILIILNSLSSSVKTEAVFDQRNIILTRAIGILIICASLCISLWSNFESRFAASILVNSSFTVDTSFPFIFSDIIMGILILFISEVFAIGYDVSKEQELTI